MRKKNIHVTPSPSGGWQVKREGADYATVHTNTQREAISIGRSLSRNEGTELLIHGRNGRIRERDTHGHDPYPPRG